MAFSAVHYGFVFFCFLQVKCFHCQTYVFHVTNSGNVCQSFFEDAGFELNLANFYTNGSMTFSTLHSGLVLLLYSSESFWLSNAMWKFLIVKCYVFYASMYSPHFVWDAEQDCGVDEKNVGEIESFFKVLLFEICPQFPVFKSSWRPQSFLCVLGLYLMTMKALGSNSWLLLLSVILNACVGIVMHLVRLELSITWN